MFAAIVSAETFMMTFSVGKISRYRGRQGDARTVVFDFAEGTHKSRAWRIPNFGANEPSEIELL